MEEMHRVGDLVRKGFIVAFVLSLVLSPFFYHLVPFLLLPILVPAIIIFIMVFFTGLTDFERRRMIQLNIAVAILVIVLYEAYIFGIVRSGVHVDIHMNVAVWLVQLMVVNLMFVLYHSFKGLKKQQEISGTT